MTRSQLGTGSSRPLSASGYARLQEVGQIAGNRSSFDVRNHGFKRLSDLMRAASENFKMERRDDKQLYVKRLR